MEILIKEIETSLTPFEIFSLFKDEKQIAFLDSARVSASHGRYSFIGLNPFLVLQGRDDVCSVNGVPHPGDVFTRLRELLREHAVASIAQTPFAGGCIGYIAYDLGLSLEQIHARSQEEVSLPHYHFIFYDNLVIADHVTGQTFLLACGKNESAEKSLERLSEKILRPPPCRAASISVVQPSDCRSNCTREAYLKRLAIVKDYIRNGDVYVVNLTHRFTAHTERTAEEIYRDLRQTNPAPFAAFLRMDGVEILSSSPERFLKIAKGVVQTHPIKGTRPRGRDAAEDALNRQALLASEKDRSELLMIVDLERNDLSKTCKPHSVKVTELFRLEEHPTVFHLVSDVEGVLKEGMDAVECLKGCFPGGSITGAPKIRAMEIIDELEGVRRGVYTGCIGYFSFDGNADFNIAIRTIIKKGKQVYFGVGGGVTWESDEAEEYQETLDKAHALMRVIGS